MLTEHVVRGDRGIAHDDDLLFLAFFAFDRFRLHLRFAVSRRGSSRSGRRGFGFLFRIGYAGRGRGILFVFLLLKRFQLLLCVALEPLEDDRTERVADDIRADQAHICAELLIVPLGGLVRGRIGYALRFENIAFQHGGDLLFGHFGGIHHRFFRRLYGGRFLLFDLGRLNILCLRCKLKRHGGIRPCKMGDSSYK